MESGYYILDINYALIKKNCSVIFFYINFILRDLFHFNEYLLLYSI